MKRRQTFCLYLGLILLALCSCDKSVQNETETNATMAKVQKRATTRVHPSELGNFVVNSDLDLESEAVVLEELISYGFLGSDEQVEITPIYSDNIVPAFLMSLIIEPESNEWYGINVNEVMSTRMEYPAVAFYIINSRSGKSFLTTADRRFPSNIIAYRSPSYFHPDILTIQTDVIYELYDSGMSVSPEELKRISKAEIESRLGIDADDNMFALDDLFTLKMCYWQFEVCMAEVFPWFDCPVTSKGSIGPLLGEDFRWGQRDVFGDCEHDNIIGSIVLSILKILYSTHYSGVLLDNYFDGCVYHNDMSMLNYFAWRLYEDIAYSDLSYTERGLEILAECGYTEWHYDNDMICVPRLDTYDALCSGKMVIGVCRDGRWYIIDGYDYTITTCSAVHLYSYDPNMCEETNARWDKLYLYNEIYLSYGNE